MCAPALRIGRRWWSVRGMCPLRPPPNTRRPGVVSCSDMDESRVRAWWFHRQGLDGSLAGTAAAEVLERSGWARSVGGAGPYVTLFARTGASREAADTACAELEIYELPSARGCTYVVPATHFGMALKLAQLSGDA